MKISSKLFTWGGFVSLLGFPALAESAPQPNVLLIVVDDMGYSDLSPFGGEIRTPTIQSMAKRGTCFNNYHCSSFSAPTRSMLLTGVDNHQNGFGNMSDFQAENQYGKEGYYGYLNKRVKPLSTLLQENGYFSFMVGKWHLGELTKAQPLAMGFQRSFALLNGGISHYADARPLAEAQRHSAYYLEDGKRVEKLPDGFYSTRYYTDKVIEYLRDAPKNQAVFGYIAFTAPHDPLHIIEEYADKYKGVYDGGYEPLKKQRLARQKQLGITPEETKANAGQGDYPRWDELSDKQRALESRKMELYAAMIEYLDFSISRIIDELKQSGRYENTIIILMSDNGASKILPEHYPESSKEYIAENFDNSLENLGKPNSFVSMGPAWAEAASTPFSYFKGLTYEGGIRTPLIIAGPGFEQAKGSIDSRLVHVTDIYPTVAELAQVALPQTGGQSGLAPFYGQSLLSGSPRNESSVLCFEMMEQRAVMMGHWKAVWHHPHQQWELYDLSKDLLEEENLASQHPELIKRAQAEWDAYAKKVGYIPSDGSFAAKRVGYEHVNKFVPADE